MPSIFIDDGFTLDGELPAKHGFPTIRFKYRLAVPEKVYAYLAEPRNGQQRASAAARLLAEHLVEWDARDNAGNAVPINERVFYRVPHSVLERLLEHVTGYGPDAREADLKN
jgi:hypothetical protein